MIFDNFLDFSFKKFNIFNNFLMNNIHAIFSLYILGIFLLNFISNNNYGLDYSFTSAIFTTYYFIAVVFSSLFLNYKDKYSYDNLEFED